MKTIEEATKDFLEYRRGICTGYPPKEWFKEGVKFAQRWIPVEEELPELGEKGYSKNVLICDDPQDEEDARIGYRITDIGTGITHWNNNEHPAYWSPIKFE